MLAKVVYLHQVRILARKLYVSMAMVVLNSLIPFHIHLIWQHLFPICPQALKGNCLTSILLYMMDVLRAFEDEAPKHH